MISEVLASTLNAGRSAFNGRFAEARRRFPGLNGDEFGAFLKTAVNDVVVAVGATRPERVAETVSVAYDVALELAGRGLAGRGALQGSIEAGWRRILPAAAACVAAAPARVLPAVCNALYHLATTPGARASQWIDDLEHLAPLCDHVDEFLKCGQIAAWRAGMAHLRAGVLEAAQTLRESLAKAALGAPAAAVWTTVREKLDRDPWFDPADAATVDANGGGPLRVVMRAGAFRGYGGLFAEPPRVADGGEYFLVASGGECWLMVADLFGATFHRAAPAEFHAAQERALRPAGVEIAGTVLRRNGASLDLSELGSFATVAANRHTLALTSPFSHAVVLVGLT